MFGARALHKGESKVPMNEAHKWAGNAREADVSAQAIKAMQKQLLDLVDIVERNPGGIFLHHEGRVLYANRTMARFLGLGESETLENRLVSTFIMPGDLSIWEAACEADGTGERRAELRLIGDHDRTTTVELSQISGMHFAGKDASVVVAHDISAQRELEHELVQVTAREQERFARDLHDGLGQLLAAITFKCQALKQSMADQAPDLVARLENIHDLVEEAANQTHAIAHGLDPVELEFGSLVSALEELAQQTASTYGITCQFTGEDPTAFVADKLVTTQFYRIAQDAVKNAVSHGQAQMVALVLDAQGERLTLSVHSTGALRTSSADSCSPGSGIRNMRHRARLIGASLDLTIAPCGDALVKCSLPFGENARG